MTAPSLEPGLRVGRYTVVQPVGRGGMGGVWEVHDDAGTRYALKSPASGLASGSENSRRFAREANALRLVDHPNLVSAVDVFAEGGYLFLVMEYVNGRTLGKRLAEGPLPARQALVLLRQVLEGVGHAHDHGLIHRDIKPENVMLVDQGGWETAKVVDFGLVKLIGDAEAAMGGGKLTSTGMVFGTPAYMAPEQALGRSVDGRADLYSVGIVLFEMLTGRTPFDSTDPMMQMRMHVKAPVPKLAMIVGPQPWCTPQLEIFVEGALAKEPDHRFASAKAMIAALDDAFCSLDNV